MRNRTAQAKEEGEKLVRALRKRRAQLDLTQAEVGAQLPVSQNTVAYWEQGRTVPGVVNRRRIRAWLEREPQSPAVHLARGAKGKR